MSTASEQHNRRIGRPASRNNKAIHSHRADLVDFMLLLARPFVTGRPLPTSNEQADISACPFDGGGFLGLLSDGANEGSTGRCTKN